jgi:isocitrate lyase
VRDSSQWGDGRPERAAPPRDEDRALVPFDEQVRQLEARWAGDRFDGIERPYSARDVVRLRGSILDDHATARLGAERLWDQVTRGDEPVRTFGALTGNQAVQMVRAGLQAIYLSGWQVAGDMNLALQTYPDQSLYPSNSGPTLVRRINNALKRADQIEWSENDGRVDTHWMAPIVADAEAGFGGPLHAHELAKSYIEAGAAGVHFEDQLAAEKKCGHMGGKVLVPTSQFIHVLSAARLASDVLDVPTVLFARTDAESATLLTSDIDERDHEFLTGERTAEGYYRVRSGLEPAIARPWPTRPTPTCCGARPRRRTWTRPGGSPRRSTTSTRASCWPTTARRRSTGSGTWTTRPSPASSASWAPWATASSSSPWPAGT